ncbi:hypothetical protein [Burkholderia stagnalis]
MSIDLAIRQIIDFYFLIFKNDPLGEFCLNFINIRINDFIIRYLQLIDSRFVWGVDNHHADRSVSIFYMPDREGGARRACMAIRRPGRALRCTPADASGERVEHCSGRTFAV